MPIKSTYKEKPVGTENKKKMKFRVSNFLVTMNTNVRFESADDIHQWTGELYKMGEHLFGDADKVGKFVTFPHGGEWDERHIVSVDSTMKVEIGHNKMGQRLHIHGTVKIRHHSFIHLDIRAIKEAANEYLTDVGYPFLIRHINVRAGRPSFEDYLDEGDESQS